MTRYLFTFRAPAGYAPPATARLRAGHQDTRQL
jgi:hypothetical protein